MEMVDGKVINFEEKYFTKYIEQIKLLNVYKKLEKEAYNKKLKIKFGYSSDKIWGSTYYNINLGLYDKFDNLVNVPKNSPYYDDLGSLLASSNVIEYNPKRNAVIEFQLDEEIIEDINMILKYLKNE